MTKAQARKLVSELIQEIDYDIWKSYFHPPSFEMEDEEVKEQVEAFIAIVLKHTK